MAQYKRNQEGKNIKNNDDMGKLPALCIVKGDKDKLEAGKNEIKPKKPRKESIAERVERLIQEGKITMQEETQ